MILIDLSESGCLFLLVTVSVISMWNTPVTIFYRGRKSNPPLTLSQSKTLPKVEKSPCRSSAEHVALMLPTNTLVELGGRARDSSTTRGLPRYSLPSRCLMALREHSFMSLNRIKLWLVGVTLVTEVATCLLPLPLSGWRRHTVEAESRCWSLHTGRKAWWARRAMRLKEGSPRTTSRSQNSSRCQSNICKIKKTYN